MPPLRVSLSSIMPIATLTPASRMRPMLDCVAAICSKLAGRSLTAEAITGTPAAAIWSRHRPAFGRADQHHLAAPGNSRRSAEHIDDVARPLDVDEQLLPPLQHRHQRRGIEAGQQHVLAAPRSP